MKRIIIFIALIVATVSANKQMLIYKADGSTELLSVANVDSIKFNTGPIAEYLFNGNAKDLSGSGFDGTVTEATPATDRFARTRNAYTFDGSNDKIDAGDNINMGTGDLSVSFWVNAPSEQTYKYIIGKYSQGNAPAWGIGTSAGEVPYAFIMDGSNGTMAIEAKGSTNICTGIWYHVVVVYDRDANLTIYVNETIENQTDISSQSGDVSNSSKLTIGCIESGAFFGGTIDDVRIYNRTLSANEVQMLYNENGWK